LVESMVSFYDVKERISVTLPLGDVEGELYTRLTADGKEQVRYALRGSYRERKLTKFVAEADFRQLLAEAEKIRRFKTVWLPDDVDVSEVDQEPLSSLLDRLDTIDELIEKVSSSGDFAHLQPREIESVIERLLPRDGYETELTPRSGDGGVDIYAWKSDPILGDLMYIVECKLWAPANKVGPDIIRQVRGVIGVRNATGGIIVTSSYFTPGALKEQALDPNRLVLHDRAAVLEWIRRTTPPSDPHAKGVRD
jgi:restriction endonuclease Mrr